VQRLRRGLHAAALLLMLAPAAVPAQTAAPAAGPTALLERGRYLVQGIVACGNCHTPQGPNGPVPGQEMAGGMVFEEPVFRAVASNITPDRETGIGAWTDAQLIRAIREGIRPDGSVIGPPMPIGLYRGISDTDARAIVAYLRSVPPVRQAVPKSVYRIPLPPNDGPPVGAVPDMPRTDRVAYGRYLAGPLGHCMECHSRPGANGVPDVVNGLGAGGLRFPGPWGVSVASNITGPVLARYSDAELKRIITSGVRPDGSRLLPPMGTAYYARMSAEDLDALVAYLRTLPAR
jgi:mono/diheme cytochrome c family protein